MAPANGAAVRPRRRDRWAHRRAEPRRFILLWTAYLFAATLLTLLAVGSTGSITVDAYRPAARIMLVTVFAGIALLWPMVRLSQVLPPHGGTVPALQDYFVIVLPSQAVIWPQWLLADWPIDVVGAVAASGAAWALAVGGVLALALTRRRPLPILEDPGPTPPQPAPPIAGVAPSGLSAAARTGWMLVFLAIALGPGLIVLLAPPAPPDSLMPAERPAYLVSPVLVVLDMTADRPWTGKSAAVSPTHWSAVFVTSLAALPIWVAAADRVRRLKRAGGLH